MRSATGVLPRCDNSNGLDFALERSPGNLALARLVLICRRMRIQLMTISLLLGCGQVNGGDEPEPEAEADAGTSDAMLCSATSEVDGCNLIDDDCDGEVDEDFVPNPPDLSRTFGEASHSYFGQALLDWRGASPVLTCTTPFAFEGSAVWSDPATGALRFFSDGESLFDADGAVVTNGAALGGSTGTTEAALFAPVPNTSYSELFVFANNLGSVFGSRFQADTGEVDLATKATPIATASSEAIGAVGDGGNGFWLVLLTGDQLDAFHVADGTIPTVAGAQSQLPVTVAASSRAGIRFSRAGNRVAIAVENPPGHWWADFDSSTGEVIGAWNEIDRHRGYSLDFSPDGTQLYFAASETTAGFASPELRQHDTKTRATQVIGLGATFSGVALASDGSIYSFQSNGSTLHRVNDPDIGGAGNFELAAVGLGACRTGFNTSRQLLPLTGCESDDDCDDDAASTADSCQNRACSNVCGE